jgi:hypothetical protein
VSAPGQKAKIPSKRKQLAIFAAISIIALTVASSFWYFAAQASSKETRAVLIAVGAALTTGTLAFMTSWATSWRTEANLDEREERTLARQTALRQETRYVALLGPLAAYENAMARYDLVMGGPQRDPDLAGPEEMKSERFAELKRLQADLVAAIGTASSGADENVAQVLDDMLKKVESHDAGEKASLPSLPTTRFREAAFPKVTL